MAMKTVSFLVLPCHRITVRISRIALYAPAGHSSSGWSAPLHTYYMHSRSVPPAPKPIRIRQRICPLECVVTLLVPLRDDSLLDWILVNCPCDGELGISGNTIIDRIPCKGLGNRGKQFLLKALYILQTRNLVVIIARMSRKSG